MRNATIKELEFGALFFLPSIKGQTKLETAAYCKLYYFYKLTIYF